MEIDKLYTNLNFPGSFSGINNIYNETKKMNKNVRVEDISKSLHGIHTYTLHKPRKIHFQRSKTIPAGFLTDFQVDLADFQKLSKHNNGHKYILLGIDVLSRKIFTAPLKSKEFVDIKNGFEYIFSQMPMKPWSIYSDQGKEFVSKKLKKYLSEYNIEKYTSIDAAVKASVAERAIKTLKNRLYKYFTHNHTLKWTDILEKLTLAINNSKCRITGLTPNQINFENAQTVWEKVYGNAYKNSTKTKFEIGDDVRISNAKHIFTKGFYPNFSDEIFKIVRINKSKPVVYHLVDHLNEEILGGFYEPELCKVENVKENIYRIEKVLKTRKRLGENEFYVKFIGYPGYQWINENNFS